MGFNHSSKRSSVKSNALSNSLLSEVLSGCLAGIGIWITPSPSAKAKTKAKTKTPHMNNSEISKRVVCKKDAKTGSSQSAANWIIKLKTTERM